MSETENKAKQIIDNLRSSGHTAYFAGGCVRDMIMKIEPKDFDIATSATPDEVEDLFEKTVPVGKAFGVIIVLVENVPFEVATFREEGDYKDGRHPGRISFTDAQKDALRRDFTANGLFYDPKEGKVIDFVQGEADIRGKCIRAIGRAEDRFEEDKLRILRAIRFASTLGFEIEKDTWNAIKKLKSKIHEVSQERIRDELVKMFTRSHAGRGLDLLSESGLLAEILPEIEAMKGVEQPAEFHPEGDVFIHTRMLLDQLENAPTVLAFGALLHDVGKPPTFSDEGPRITFYGHERVGAEMTRDIMKRLRFSNLEIDQVVECVDNHMKFGAVRDMREGKLKRFVSRETFPIELELHRIDCMASHEKMELFEFLNEKIKAYAAEDLKPKPVVNGRDLLELGIEAGPIMKEILENMYQEQLEGSIKAREDALEWVKQRYSAQIKPIKGNES